jgi:ElaB/YqjD/DUF883 family membrane-anchored ribosome-binding protein
MDEDTRKGSAQLSESEGADREPEEIRRDIEATRSEVGDTVEALAEKTDVKAQAKGRVDEIKANVSQKKDEFVTKARDAAPSSGGEASGQASQAATQAREAARQNPIPFAVGGALVLGFLIGRLTSR